MLIPEKKSEQASTRGFSLSFLVDYSGTIASRQWRRLPNGGQESQGNNIKIDVKAKRQRDISIVPKRTRVPMYL